MHYLRITWCLASAFFAGTLSGQVATLQIRIVEGEGSILPPGSRLTRPITVEVTDEAGRPVPHAAVSFHVPDDGPGASFANGLRTMVATTGADGRASIRGLQVNRVPGRFQIRIFASKEQARAGTVSFQTVGDAPPPSSRWHRRWTALAVLAGGGAVAGLLTAGRSSTPAAAPASVPQPPAVSIGAPSVTVGKP
jgi:hypothetical protein